MNMQLRLANLISQVRSELTTPTEAINQAIGYLNAMTDAGEIGSIEKERQLTNFTEMILTI